MTKTTQARAIIATEDQEQAALAQWLDLRHVLYSAIPNGGWRHPATAGRLKATGTKAGVPDILIFDFPPRKAMFVGTAIELKRTRGGRLSDAQARWLIDLQNRGWMAITCYGAGHAIEELTKLGY